MICALQPPPVPALGPRPRRAPRRKWTWQASLMRVPAARAFGSWAALRGSVGRARASARAPAGGRGRKTIRIRWFAAAQARKAPARR